MKTGLIFVVTCVFSIIKGCSSESACRSSHQKPVVGACTNTQSGRVNDTLYIDTGTGPNKQENQCRCRLSVSQTNIELVFQSLDGANSFNHSIEVADYVLNKTTTRLEVIVISDPTDLWIKTDGIGGVCVSVTRKPTGPVVGGASGFVVLVSIIAISIYCKRRKYTKQQENGTHSDKSSNAQTNSKYTDTTENSVSDKAVVDNRAISIIDSSYDDVNLDRDSGCHKDKKKKTENDCHFSVYHTNKKPVQKGVTNQNEEKLAVYSVVNKHPKLLTNTTQDTNETVYDRTNNSDEKMKGVEEYNRLGDNVYDRTNHSVEKVKGAEEYNRLGAFKVRGINTDETYDSAATNTGYNVDRNVQNEYATSYRKH